MGRAKASVAKIRERRAIALALQGKTYAAIAEELNYANASGAYEAVQRALAAEPVPDIEEARRQQIARLDAMIDSLWKTATLDLDDALPDETLGEPEDYKALRAATARAIAREEAHIKAVDAIRKLEERRSKLLGMDAPTKFEGKTELTTPDELMNGLLKLAGIDPEAESAE